MYLKNTEATYIKLDPDDTLPLEHEGSCKEDVDCVDENNHNSTTEQFFHQQQLNTPSNNNNTATITRSDKMMEQLSQGLVQLTLHQDLSGLKTNMAPWRDYGDFVRWSSEPTSLPNHYTTGSLEMPAKGIQEQLIHVFFTHCHTHLPPTMSKRMFYDQLHAKGPLITPLLLNMIYAHASVYQLDHDQPPPPLGIPAMIYSSTTPSTDADRYYQRARQLLDDFMDVPRISTVIALLYMVAYEDKQRKEKGRSSRAWMYSGMAIRMCLELGLHTSHYSSQMSQFDIELRKRVLWTCYVMDKLESCTMERPWMLRSQDITLDLPTSLPEDDQKERSLLDGFSHLCRLMMLVEQVLVFFTSDSRGSEEWTTKKESQVLFFLDKLAQWRDHLPEDLQWRHDGLLPTSSMVATLHLLSYDLELSLVLCCRFQMEPIQGERRRAVAMVVTQLVNCTIQHPRLMWANGSLSAFSGIFGALVHAMDVDHPVLNVAKDAKYQFKLSLEMIRGLVLDRLLFRDVHSFVGLIDTFLHPSAPAPATTSSASSPFMFTSAMNHLYNSPTPTNPSTTTSGTTSSPIASNVNSTQSLPDHDKLLQHMLGSNDLYEAQMLAKTMSTLQQHHQHHQRAFPTPFTTPSPPPSSSSLLLNPLPQQHLFHLHHQQEGSTQQQLYPPISSSSSASSVSSSPPLRTATSMVPGMFTSQGDAAAAAAAAAVGAVGTPLTNPPYRDPSPLMTIPPTGLKNIEPADYTFELISVDDEWAKSLNYT